MTSRKSGAGKPRIVIAGGGTGGHVFPGLAIATQLEKLADVEVIFVGSPRGLEKDLVPVRGYALELLDVEPIKGGGIKRAFRGALVAARATWRARSLVNELKPAVVVSVGGYAAGPMALASAASGVPLAIVEPNGVLGLANRILSPVAKRAYVAWPDVMRSKIVRPLGVPLRDGFEASPYRAGSSARVLVMGGSQGARAINDAMPEAIAAVKKRVPHVEVLHQSGRGQDEAVRAAYEALGVRADVRAFLDDVPGELARADVVVARSGAGAVAEIAAIGRAAIFVPFPFAADDHQRANAESLSKSNAAVCIIQREATPAKLAREIGALLEDAARREAMANAARRMGRPHAARDIAEDLLHLARIPMRISRPKTNGSSAEAH
jgi:UDP-N-acetylglucosamine--N-acetylmuramyl-(pentapeptide) pyrophosphoryl-undecaprenol N-acetylglucosamine transferase